MIAELIRQDFVAIEITWNAACVAVRISMTLLYIRLFITRTFRRVCWSVIALNVVNLIAIIIASCAICRPIAYSFDKTIVEGTCGHIIIFEHYTAGMSLVTDAIIVILPMPMLWRLQMSLKRKIQLSCVLGMGIV